MSLCQCGCARMSRTSAGRVLCRPFTFLFARLLLHFPLSSPVKTTCRLQVELSKDRYSEGSVSHVNIVLASASLTDLGTKDSRWRSLVSPSQNPVLPRQEVRISIEQVLYYSRAPSTCSIHRACVVYAESMPGARYLFYRARQRFRVLLYAS